MFSLHATRIRAAVLALVAALTGFGILPAGVEAALEANADKVIAGLAAGWAIFAGFTPPKAPAA